MTKQIPLTQGMFALVDDDVFESLNRYKWHTRSCASQHYAVRQLQIGYKKQRVIYMHREIFGIANAPTPIVDHINRNGLDNRRENMRLVTKRQNCQNRRPGRTSKYRGVCWHTVAKKWKAAIADGTKNKHLGCFVNEVDAARAYDIALIARGLQPINFPLADY